MSATVRAARSYVRRATLPGCQRNRRSPDWLDGLQTQNRLTERWYRFGTLRYVLYRYGREWQGG